MHSRTRSLPRETILRCEGVREHVILIKLKKALVLVQVYAYIINEKQLKHEDEESL